jgi:deaminated glutathione amidase
MKIAVIQFTSGDDVATNLLTAQRLISAAAGDGARVIQLPENLALMSARERDKVAIAEQPGRAPLQDWLRHQAMQHGVYLIGGTLPLVADDPERIRASCLVVGPDGEWRARYDKIHLFDVETERNGQRETYRESRSIEAGPLAPVVVDIDGWRFGLSVCYDLRFPELYRALVTAGAEVLCVPSAFTAQTGQAHWETLLRARAIENTCYVMAANQCGTHPGNRQTWGHSAVISPWGDPLSILDGAPGYGIGVLEREKLLQLRSAFPCLHHRRL